MKKSFIKFLGAVALVAGQIPISRALVLGCLVCGLGQSGATAANIYNTVSNLYLGTGSYASVSYTDQSAFNAAVTGQVGPDFTLFNGFYSSPLNVPVSGHTISASATGGLFVSGGLFSTNNPVDLIFTFTGTLPTAVGGLFFMTDPIFNAASSAIKVSLSDGTFINLPAPTGAALNLTGAFAGFTSNVGINSLTVSSVPGSVPASVPETGSSALLGVIGLLGLVVYRKRMN